MKLQLEGISIEAISLAGFYTCIQFPEYKIAIDLGISPRSAINKGHVFFTHAHGDHIAGVVRHCSSREMLRLTPPTYVIGKEDIENFHGFMDAARKMCRSGMPYEAIGISPGDHIDVRRDLRVRSYRSIHRVPCQGYIVYELKQKLRKEFVGLERNELISRRKSGEVLTEDIERPLVTYTGDTTIDLFIKEPALQDVPVLITEVTFFDDSVSKESAKMRGHIHIDDIVDNIELFTQKSILLMHSSARFNPEQIIEICRQKLPPELFKRVHILPNNQALEGF